MKSFFKSFLNWSIFAFCIPCLYGTEGISIAQHSTFPELCQEAAINDELFAKFRNHIGCRGIVDTVVFDLGIGYLNWIYNECPHVLTQDYLEKFRLNDALGGPLTFDYGIWGVFSPTTIRYIKVGSEIQKIFGDLSQMNIVEIGGGYGGQCKIIHDLGGFASYTIIDLPEVNALARKYLALQGIENVFFIDCDKVTGEKKFDLVISNYAFTEVDQNQQLHYFKTVINPTPRGYMILNFISDLFNVPSLKEKELLDLLLGNRTKNEKLLPEIPLTYVNNALLVWSEDN